MGAYNDKSVQRTDAAETIAELRRQLEAANGEIMVAELTAAELRCQLNEANKNIAEMTANKGSQNKLLKDLRTRELIPKPGKYHAMSQSVASCSIPSHPVLFPLLR